MLDWKPGRSLLGFLTTKLAQEAEGQVPGNQGFLTPQQGPGVANPYQMMAGGLGYVAGDDTSAVFQAFYPLFAPYLASRGIDVMKPYQLQYGASADDARAMRQIQQTVMLPSMQSLGVNVANLIAKGGDALTDMTGGKINGKDIADIYNKIPNDKGQRDAVMGQFVGTFARSDPQFAAGLQTLLPGAVLDWDPLVKATYGRSKNGTFNPADFTQTKTWFENAYKQGQFGTGVPAQLALEAVPYAVQVAGPNATAQQITNLARVGMEIQGRHMAPTFGASMEMATGMGNPARVLNDPNGMMAEVEQLHQYMKRVPNLDPREAYNAVRLAREKGLSPAALFEGMGAGSAAAREFSQGVDTPQSREIARGAADAMARFSSSDSVKALAALKASNPAWGRSIDQMIATSNVQGLNQATEQAMRDPASWPYMHSADTSELVQAIGERPGLTSGIMGGEVQRYAKLTNNPELGALVANPKELTRRLQQNDMSGLSPRTVDALSPSGATGGRLVGALLMSQRALRDANYDQASGRIPEQPVRWTTPLPHPLETTPTKPVGPLQPLPAVASAQQQQPMVGAQPTPETPAPARTVRPYVPSQQPPAAPTATAPVTPAAPAPARTVRPYVPSQPAAAPMPAPAQPPPVADSQPVAPPPPSAQPAAQPAPIKPVSTAPAPTVQKQQYEF